MKSLTMEKRDALGAGDVQLHLLRYDKTSSNSTGNYLYLLSSDEQDLFKFIELESRRREFLWSRLFLRRVLSLTLGKEMSELKFSRGDFGKPFLEASDLQFNLSHTDQLIACSVSRHRVGIDIERVISGEKAEEQRMLLAKRHFSTAEQDYLNSQPEDSRALVFYQIFTLKEAYVKALGAGLNVPFPGFSVPLPLREKSRWGGWEFFTRVLSPTDIRLAHVVENPNNDFCRYEIFDWDQDYLPGGPLFEHKMFQNN